MPAKANGPLDGMSDPFQKGVPHPESSLPRGCGDGCEAGRGQCWNAQPWTLRDDTPSPCTAEHPECGAYGIDQLVALGRRGRCCRDIDLDHQGAA
jgi:hypothetical protein